MSMDKQRERARQREKERERERKREKERERERKSEKERERKSEKEIERDRKREKERERGRMSEKEREVHYNSLKIFMRILTVFEAFLTKIEIFFNFPLFLVEMSSISQGFDMKLIQDLPPLWRMSKKKCFKCLLRGPGPLGIIQF